MLKPYSIYEESESGTTYQYNTLYSWAWLGLLVAILATIFLNNTGLQLTTSALIVILYGIKLILGREVSNKIRQALKSGSVEVSGSKYSFSKPIRVKISKSV